MTDFPAHSAYGGSSIARVIACPGSAELCRRVPPRPESSYAREGSAAHRLAELCLLKKMHPAALLGKDVPGFPGIPVTLDMSDAVVKYLNVLETELAQTTTSVLLIEQDFVLPIEAADEDEVFGRCDAVVYHPETGRLRGFDYKHGAGVAVDVTDSKQLKFYLLGVVLAHPEWLIREIVATVVQPRLRDLEEGGEVKDWVMDRVELFEFHAEIEAAVADAKDAAKRLDLGGPNMMEVLNTGDHCRWCDAAPVCPARERQALEAAQVDFASVVDVTAKALPEPKTLDVERLAKVVEGIGILNAWAAQCMEYLEGLVMGGTDVPGWKAVEKIGRASWVVDQHEIAGYAELMFGVGVDEIMPPKLITITDAAKLLKANGATKTQIDEFKLRFTIKESSGLTIAPASDKRPAVNAVAQDFAQVQPITV